MNKALKEKKRKIKLLYYIIKSLKKKLLTVYKN